MTAAWAKPGHHDDPTSNQRRAISARIDRDSSCVRQLPLPGRPIRYLPLSPTFHQDLALGGGYV